MALEQEALERCVLRTAGREPCKGVDKGILRPGCVETAESRKMQISRVERNEDHILPAQKREGHQQYSLLSEIKA